MDENDLRIRKHWLIMWAVSMLTAVANQLLLVLFNDSSSWSVIPALVVAPAAGFVLYHCVYKKRGTKLLIFCLIFTAASLLINLIFYLSGKLNPPAHIPYYGTFLLMTQGMGILWMIVCWRMLKVNRKLRAVS